MTLEMVITLNLGEPAISGGLVRQKGVYAKMGVTPVTKKTLRFMLVWNAYVNIRYHSVGILLSA
jgi:hypothetical protein